MTYYDRCLTCVWVKVYTHSKACQYRWYPCIIEEEGEEEEYTDEGEEEEYSGEEEEEEGSEYETDDEPSEEEPTEDDQSDADPTPDVSLCLW